jgi:hypothetical protein
MGRSLLAALVLALSASACLAEDVDPRCAIHGEGFHYSESTGSCIKISGDVRADFRAGGGESRFGGEAGLSVDARKDTEAGPFRLFFSPKAKAN